MRAVVTAGGTSEPLDDVRVLTNLSTGRFGAAIAGALARRGWEVTLLASRALCGHPEWIDARVRVVPFSRFADLSARLDEALQVPPDALFMAAAVSDYRPEPAQGKIRSTSDTLTLTLTRNPKLLSTLRARCGDRATLVGFKLLSGVSAEALCEVARRQIADNGLDLCLANDLAELGRGRHPAWLVDRDGGALRLQGSKAEVAEHLVDAVHQRRSERAPTLAPPGVLHLRGDGALPEVFAALPGLAALLLQPRSLILPSIPAADPPAAAPDAADLVASLGRLAWRGAWHGGGFSAALAQGGLVGLGPAELDGLGARWARIHASFSEALHAQGHDPDLPDPLPVWHGATIVGACWERRVAQGTARALWLHPDARGVGLGDRLLARMSALGHPAWAPSSLVPYFEERGWLPSPGEADGARLLPPSARTDLIPAASVCLLDPVGRRVLLGRRLVGPWPGYWAFPGGKAEGTESLLTTALRELAEETSIALGEVRPLASRPLIVGGARGYHVTNFVVATLDPPAPSPTPELDAHWFSLDEAAALRPMAAGTRRLCRPPAAASLPVEVIHASTQDRDHRLAIPRIKMTSATVTESPVCRPAGSSDSAAEVTPSPSRSVMVQAV